MPLRAAWLLLRPTLPVNLRAALSIGPSNDPSTKVCTDQSLTTLSYLKDSLFDSLTEIHIVMLTLADRNQLFWY